MRWFIKLVDAIAYAHEWFHYIAARAFGLNPEIGSGYTEADSAAPLVLILVAAAPGAAGLAVGAALLYAWKLWGQAEPAASILFSLLWLDLGWILACIYDLIYILRQLRKVFRHER